MPLGVLPYEARDKVLLDAGGRLQITRDPFRRVLTALPRGAYTAALCLEGAQAGRRKVPGWELHRQRLVRSWAEIARDQGLPEPSAAQRTSALQRISTIAWEVLEALRRDTASFSEGDTRAALILHVCGPQQGPPGGGALRVTGHASVLPPGPAPPRRAVVVGLPRPLPAAKDTLWITARQPLEARRGGPGAEGLLRGADGRLLEGLTTSLFVVAPGADDQPVLQTAREGVLPGVMAALVKQAAEVEGIPVLEEAPDIHNSDIWSEAFLTNGLQGMIPLSSFSESGGDWHKDMPSGQGPVFQRLQAGLSAVFDASPLLEPA